MWTKQSQTNRKDWLPNHQITCYSRELSFNATCKCGPVPRVLPAVDGAEATGTTLGAVVFCRSCQLNERADIFLACSYIPTGDVGKDRSQGLTVTIATTTSSAGERLSAQKPYCRRPSSCRNRAYSHCFSRPKLVLKDHVRINEHPALDCEQLLEMHHDLCAFVFDLGSSAGSWPGVGNHLGAKMQHSTLIPASW